MGKKGENILSKYYKYEIVQDNIFIYNRSMSTMVRLPWTSHYNHHRCISYSRIGAHIIIMTDIFADNKSTYILAENYSKIEEFAITVRDIFNGSFAAACSLIIKRYDEYCASYSIIDNDLRRIDNKNVDAIIKSFCYFNSDYSDNEAESLMELKRDVARYIRRIKCTNISAPIFLGGLKNIFCKYVDEEYLVDDFTRSKMPYFRLITKVKQYLDD